MQDNISKTLIVFIGFISIYWAADAQKVESFVEPQKIFMGQHVVLSFEFQVDENTFVAIPAFNEKINDNIEIINYGTTDTTLTDKDGVVKIKRTLTVTSWEEGFHPIEPAEFLFIKTNDTLVVESEPLLLEVEPFDIDEHTDLKDVKSVMEAPVTFREILPWLILAILAMVVGYFIHRYIQKRKHKPAPQTIWQKPQIPAHIAAFNSLEKLKSLKLWEQGKVKEYHSELSDIIRRYLDKRFEINAMEMTSSEIFSTIEHNLTSEQARELIIRNLSLADMVKFAKMTPDATDNQLAMEDAFEFVRITMEEVQNNK